MGPVRYPGLFVRGRAAAQLADRPRRRIDRRAVRTRSRAGVRGGGGRCDRRRQYRYWIGRSGGRALVDKATARFGGAAKVAAAEAFARRWSGTGIFFTRWLVGALGPWINVTSGMSGYPWPRFLLWDVTGEILWVVLYGGLGYAFSDRIQAVASLLGSVSWAVAGFAVTGLLAWRLWRRHRDARADGDAADIPIASLVTVEERG